MDISEVFDVFLDWIFIVMRFIENNKFLMICLIITLAASMIEFLLEKFDLD